MYFTCRTSPRHALYVAIVAKTAGVVGLDVALTLNAHAIHGDEALPTWAAKRWTRPARLNSDTNRSPPALNATPWGAVTMPGRHFEGSVRFEAISSATVFSPS